MYDLIDSMRAWTPVFMLMFTRLTAMIMIMPVVSYPVISSRIRLLLSLGIAVVIFPLHTAQLSLPDSLAGLVIAVLREAFIGLIIGFGVKMIFEALQMAGAFIGRQMGLEMAQVMDPATSSQVPILSHFWLLVMITFFFAVDGHHLLIAVIAHSFDSIPVGGGAFPAALGHNLVHGGSMTFSIALKCAAPVMALLLLVDIAIALMARVMPQMNVFFVTLPLKIGVGIFGLIVSLEIFQLFFDVFYVDLKVFIQNNIDHLAG